MSIEFAEEEFIESEISEVNETVQGGFGWPCSSNDDCLSGFCVESLDGNICTIRCMAGADCPPDFICSGVVNTYPDVTFVCLPKFGRLCSPCSTDNQCAGGKCVAFGADGFYCSVICNTDEDCVSSYVCRENGDQKVCMPPSGTCQCRAADAGVKRTCFKHKDGVGTCYGYETCDPAVGFVGCDAREPVKEECNGIDDDCNGIPDDNLPVDMPCERSDPAIGSGVCKGFLVCLGPQGWVCTAATPIAEICNGVDDDCDGEVDEDFKNAEGKYASLTDCGACFKTCLDIFPHATPACDASQVIPRCVVAQCDEGYYKLNDYQCIPIGHTICETCVVDADCLGPGARCLDFPDGKYCANRCESDDECPPNFHCKEVDSTTFCIPDSGTCSCNGDPNLVRTCSVTWTDPDPTKPSYTCKGLQHCGPFGWGPCELPVEQCNGVDDDCNGVTDEGFLVNGKYVTDQNCGICGNNCSAMSIANGYGTCNANKAVPDCTISCNKDYVDVNGNPTDGCECHIEDSIDLAGDGKDANCDGIDGEITNGIFVAKWGNDSNDGSILAPLLTIQAGIEKAFAEKKRDVYVATGVYSGPIRLKALVQVHGGYSADFRVHEPVSYETVVLGGPPSASARGAVNAENISGQPAGTTVFEGFIVFAYDNKSPGGNSVGIYLRNCDASVMIRNCRIIGGAGGDGTHGQPGLPGEKGEPGQPGLAAIDIGSSTCNASKHRPGGAGGMKSCGDTDVSGGDGGTAVCPDFNESSPPRCPQLYGEGQTVMDIENGSPGKNNPSNSGLGGSAGFDAIITSYWSTLLGTCLNQTDFSYCTRCMLPDGSMQGADGLDGHKGEDGSPGSGCNNPGFVSGGEWKGMSGSDGKNGANGGGGGGGGAGGGVETYGCEATNPPSSGYSDIGGSGGGGGSGGCGATGGKGGGPGGGSFGIFIVFDSSPLSVPTVSDSVIVPGRGGAGGNGGLGGVGGAGGAGASGGLNGAGNMLTFCAPGGGHGGTGGAGGHGGGGGGGCGGPAYGLFVYGAPAQLLSSYKSSGITFIGTAQGGPGGIGGASLGNSGGNGADGPAGDYNF